MKKPSGNKVRNKRCVRCASVFLGKARQSLCPQCDEKAGFREFLRSYSASGCVPHADPAAQAIRQARIARYEERARLGLPLFDGQAEPEPPRLG